MTQESELNASKPWHSLIVVGSANAQEIIKKAGEKSVEMNKKEQDHHPPSPGPKSDNWLEYTLEHPVTGQKD